MESKFKRPASVLIAQTIFVVLSLLFLSALILMFLDIFERPSRIRFLLIGLRPIPILLAFLFVASSLMSFCGLMFRKSFGRWLAVGILAVVFALGLMGLTSMARSGPSLTFLPLIVLTMGVLFPIYELTFGKTVIMFFNEKRDQLPVQGPPPPPSFDSE